MAESIITLIANLARLRTDDVAKTVSFETYADATWTAKWTLDHATGKTTQSFPDDVVTNAILANMTRGTVKVGGTGNAPTDLDAKGDGKILVGDGTDVKSVAVSGDITLTNAGATAIGAEKVTYAMLADRQKIVMNVRKRVTAAQVNAGHELLPAVAGKKYRVVDFSAVAVGGNASGATSVDLKAGATTVAAIGVAALTRSTVVKPFTANVTLLTDGASFAPMGANTAITVIKNGGDLATATDVDVMLSYTLED